MTKGGQFLMSLDTAFFASLQEPTTAHLALRLLILTGHRVKPVRFLHTDHIEGDVWTAPPELLAVC